jgi:hypothetical protein
MPSPDFSSTFVRFENILTFLKDLAFCCVLDYWGGCRTVAGPTLDEVNKTL